jgi:putative Mg2+ transporter-C (MgtC) family protein
MKIGHSASGTYRMDKIWTHMGNLHTILPHPWAEVALILCSILCGLALGIEREVKNKPAGLKTVALICVGSTIFTLASLAVGLAYGRGDPGRIAAQIIPGIGFLGAGAILRDRGTVIGLTTGATIWTTAAIGMVIGEGYAVAAFALTGIVLIMLTGVRRIENGFRGPCQFTTARVVFRPDSGKSFLHVLQILDEASISDGAWETHLRGELEVMDIRYCHYHREHRAFLLRISELPEVVEIEADRSARRRDESQDHPEA